MSTPLVLPCPHCEDGTRWVSRYGGNDPDTWATKCLECDGTGNQEFLCDYQLCPEPATEEINNEYFCAIHGAIVRAEAADEG